MANLGVSKMNSPWMRSCERKWQVVGGVTSGKKIGVNIQGRILFKQSKIVNRASVTPKCNRKRLNFKSNIAGIVKLVNTLQLRDEHMIFLRKTPFWLMFEAILINQLDHTKFRKGDDLLVNIIRAYNSRDGVFHIRGHSVSVVDEDIRLIFGIQCGTGFLDLTPRPKSPSNFIQRRCHNTNRITSKLVRNLLVEAVVGSTDRDVEDTAKLLCLYACEKLFFSNSEETISWALIRYVDNLEAMRTYDWTGAIRSSLMCSIRDYHRTPEKVTGCVVALMYWLCEHTRIIKPVSDSAFPRFLKWDITKLINTARGVKLTGHVEFEVTVGRLTAREHEVAILEADRLSGLGRAGNVIDGENANVQDDDFEVGNVGVDVTRVGVELMGQNGECGSSSTDMPSTVKDLEKKLESHRVDSVLGLCAQTKTITEVEMEINTKDTVIAELRAEVEKLRRTNDTQTLHLVGGFGTLLQVKHDELNKLRTENIELRRALAVYEEQFTEREVHNVTQAFRDAGPGCNMATEDNIIDLTDVAANHEQYTVNGNQVSVLEVTPIAEQTNEDTIMRPIVEAQTDVIIISPIVAEGGRDICGPNSFVQNIKCKVRKELKMPGFEYQELRGRTVNKGVVAGSATMADVGCSRERAASKGVIDVDEVVVCLNKKSGFDINNRHSVWKMMTVEEKSKGCDVGWS